MPAALLLVGVLLFGAAWIGIVIAGFRKSVPWGLICIFVPGGNVIFGVLNWQAVKRPLLVWLCGFGFVFLGLMLQPASDAGALSGPAIRDNAMSAPPSPAPAPTRTVLMPTPVPTPPLAPPASAPLLFSGSPSPLATPEGARLRVYFGNPFPNGRLIVRVGSVEVLNRLLEAKKNEVSPPIDEMVPVGPGDQRLQLWAISTDRTINAYQALPVSCSAGEIRTLELELQPAGLAVALH